MGRKAQPYFRTLFFGVPALGPLFLLVTFLLVLCAMCEISFYVFAASTDDFHSTAVVSWLAFSAYGLPFFGLIGTAMFGCLRILGFHPAWNDDYRKYLAVTPFDGGRALPLGPIGFHWKDGLVWALAVAGTVVYSVIHESHAAIGLYTVAMAVAFPYVMLAGWTLLNLGPRFAAWVLFYGSLLLLPTSYSYVGAALCLVLFLVAQHFTSRNLSSVSLDSAPILFGLVRADGGKKMDGRTKTGTQQDFGWPFDSLPNPHDVTVTDWRNVCARSGWVLAASSLAVIYLRDVIYAPASSSGDLMVFPALFVALMSIVPAILGEGTIVSIWARYRCRLSLRARISTRRFIEPACDRLFVPVLYVVFWLATSSFWHEAYSFFIPFALAALPLVVHFSLPDPRRYMLTAPVSLRTHESTTERFKRL